MTISFELPMEIEQQIRTDGADLDREARELYLVELYRQDRISHAQLVTRWAWAFTRPRSLSRTTAPDRTFPLSSSRSSEPSCAGSDRDDCRLRHGAAALPRTHRCRTRLTPALHPSAHSPRRPCGDEPSRNARAGSSLGVVPASMARNQGPGPHRGHPLAREEGPERSGREGRDRPRLPGACGRHPHGRQDRSDGSHQEGLASDLEDVTPEQE